MTDKEMIGIHSKCGGGPVTKENILSEHQKKGGPLLTWEQLKNQHITYGPLPVGIHNVKLEGTLEEGLTGEVIEGTLKNSLKDPKTVCREYPICPDCGAIYKECCKLDDGGTCGSCEKKHECVSSKLCEYILNRILDDFKEKCIKSIPCQIIEIKEYIEGSVENFLKFEVDYSKGYIKFEDLIQLIDKKYPGYYEVVEDANMREDNKYIR